MMKISSAALYVATVVTSGAIGWTIHVPDASRRPELVVASVQSAPSTQNTPSPLIAVSSDGNVTLRVEQQPLEWVLEQIAQQSGWNDPKARVAGAPPPTDAACPEPSPLARAQTAQLLQKIQHGAEEDRYQGLLQARSEGASVPEETLKTMFESDASDRVRLIAFEGYLEARSGDSGALRSALEAALYVPSEAIQREARARLDELAESQRIDAAANQGSGS